MIINSYIKGMATQRLGGSLQNSRADHVSHLFVLVGIHGGELAWQMQKESRKAETNRKTV